MRATHYIMRIVPKDTPAEGWGEHDEELDLDEPCDLVMLTAAPDHECEISRLSFKDGHDASRRMLDCLRGKHD